MKLTKPIPFITLLVMVIATSILPFSCTKTVQEQKRPNIIFIITDDQQVGLLGIEGSPVSITPNIDRIGKEGVMFKNAFVITPLCSPSRASFLTGQYAHKHEVINNDKLGLDVISHTLMTWPRQLREAGYETAFIGKWHMGLDDSRRPGYDRWFSFKGQGAFIDPVVNDEGTRIQTTGYMTDIINEQAVDFVNRDHNQKPFAMIISHKATHWPILPAKRHEALYHDYKFESPPVSNDDLKGKPLLTRDFDREASYFMENILPEPAEPRRGRGRDPSSVVGDELRCLASVDEGVGHLFAALEKSGQLDNTIIIYTSDNGMLMGEHGKFNAKRWAYDPVLRVPMLVRYPRLVTEGSVREQMVLNIDVAPTLLELAEVEPLIPIHGQSFVSLLQNADAPWRQAFLAEYFLEKVSPRERPWKAVRTERWKYIEYTEEGIPAELYDLQADPKEEHNLIDQPEQQTNVEALQKQLNDLLKETN
jgi:arylsulfatase A-like enzyme